MERQIAVTDSPKWREKHQTRTMKLCFGFVLLLVAAPAPARDNGQCTNSPTNVRQWFQRLMQPDNPRVSCCGEADAFEADRFEVEGDHYVAIITGHRAVTAIPLGSRIPVPRQKMKYDAGNPTGHGIIFIDAQRRVLCYVTPAAG